MIGTTFLSIVFVGTKRMRAINKKYLNHDYVTDVLTFDLGEGQGEIIICPQSLPPMPRASNIDGKRNHFICDPRHLASGRL